VVSPVVTVPDPEEPDRGGEGPRPDSAQDTDAAFAGIVANWQAEPDAPRWPAPDAPHRPTEDEPVATDQTTLSVGPAGARRSLDDEDHFEPPEPPPLPVPRPRTVGGALLLILGVLLLVRPGLLNLSQDVGLPLGLLLLTAAIGWLVLGLRSGPPPGDGWDDGARL
jgi:hypothetical protein